MSVTFTVERDGGLVKAVARAGRYVGRASVRVADWPTVEDAEIAALDEAEDIVAWKADPVIRDGS